jgi:AmmeMemoRadiSam system protein A
MTPLSPTERAALLGIARGAILAHLGLRAAPELPLAGALGEPRGAFVTLTAEGELRGCIGTFQASEPLARTVARMAVAAASEDPRFSPVVATEVPRLTVAISALGPRQPLADPRAVRVGVDGLVVRSGWHRGALLPRVPVEHGWNAEEFLKHACLKAGLHARAWEEPGTELEVFQAEEFGEEPAP